jgi:hypothetical protein
MNLAVGCWDGHGERTWLIEEGEVLDRGRHLISASRGLDIGRAL